MTPFLVVEKKEAKGLGVAAGPSPKAMALASLDHEERGVLLQLTESVNSLVCSPLLSVNGFVVPGCPGERIPTPF